ncbi:MAG: NAD(P)/FAD-dependent oxidoreductase [Chitinispirillaceae bacterium]|jgi:geranylgeranyl reductase family protein|nr:NAD(P)/FAD-dependent oxidoreductase [Chitinispirillaceae bacterium]
MPAAHALTQGRIFDIIIIGAGPAGLSAGRHALNTDRKHTILLLDAIVPWEHPIQCAEAVGKAGFTAELDIKQSWIRQEIWKACFHAPDGGIVTYTDKVGGYIIDRAAMQKDLTHDLMNKGVTCVFNCRVRHVATQENLLRTVTLCDGTQVHGRVIIDASGPVAGLGRDEQIAWKPGDLEPAYFVYAEDLDLAPDTVHIYAGRELAPGGYAWVFPRGRNAANIGLLVGRRFTGKVNIRGLLDAFLSRQFPSLRIVHRFAGAIPCGCEHGPVVAPGLIKTGDAASTVNPISRAGISEALCSGGLAGDCARLMLEAKNDRERKHIGIEYEKLWREKRGARHEKLAKTKNALLSVPDADYNTAAAELSSLPPDKVTMSKIFTTSLSRFPRLVWSLRYLM